MKLQKKKKKILHFPKCNSAAYFIRPYLPPNAKNPVYNVKLHNVSGCSYIIRIIIVNQDLKITQPYLPLLAWCS